jgi:hypothetical protein
MLRMVASRELGMSDQDLAAEVERLRRRQEQTEDNLVALAGVVEDLLEQVETNPMFSMTTGLALSSAHEVIAAIKQTHHRNHGAR